MYQHFPWDLANVNEWKIMFDPSIDFQRIVHSQFLDAVLISSVHIGSSQLTPGFWLAAKQACIHVIW